MNIAQARKDAEQLAAQLRAIAADEERTLDELKAKVRDLATAADNVALMLTPVNFDDDPGPSRD